jgi:hypothetical protein
VSVKDYTTVGTGQSIEAALDDFNTNMRGSSSGSVIDSGANKQTIEGTVSRFAAESQSGSTVYIFTLSEKPEQIFTSTYDISNQLALTKEGDKVKLSCIPESGNMYTVMSFANETFSKK